MSLWNKRKTFGALGLAAGLGAASGAQAYGPEGMFGGRMNPDDTYVVTMPAQGEDKPDRGETVLEHPRPDYDPVPVQVGSFNLFPSVESGVEYNSNILAARHNTIS